MNREQNSKVAGVSLGILGGGQLARMLALEAHRLGLPVAVLSTKSDDPAAQVCGHWVKGDPTNRDDLKAFFEQCSAVTFESEFFDAGTIAHASRDTGVAVYPNPELMEKIQDRKTQKAWLDESGVATAEWRALNSRSDAGALFAELGGAVVFKKRRGGYDGYGTFVVKSKKALAEFVAQFDDKSWADSFIVEKFVPFRRELAVIAVRDRSRTIVFLPWVESKQQDSRCLWVQGPLAPTKALGARLKALESKIKRMLAKADYVGAIAFECFETTRGEILINELAPRVHNSGHYSLDTLSASQFVLHAQACLGLKIEAPRVLFAGFAMWNLLGAKSKSDASSAVHPENGTLGKVVGSKAEGARVHWYGKDQARPGRKLGHLNTWANSPAAAMKLAERAAKQWKKKTGL